MGSLDELITDLRALSKDIYQCRAGTVHLPFPESPGFSEGLAHCKLVHEQSDVPLDQLKYRRLLANAKALAEMALRSGLLHVLSVTYSPLLGSSVSVRSAVGSKALSGLVDRVNVSGT